MKYKHPCATVETSNKGQQPKDIVANLNETEVCCSVLDDGSAVTPSDYIVVIDSKERFGNKQRGSEKRKLYTVESKKKTIDLLDSLMSPQNKYEVVQKEKGILIDLWCKNWTKMEASYLRN